MTKQKLSYYDGNGRKHAKSSPTIIILDRMNDGAFAHIQKQTRLNFVDTGMLYIAENTTFQKISKLLWTYNFRTRYFNNFDHKNTLMLKFCHDEEWNF